MAGSTSRGEPEYTPELRREVYTKGLNAGSFLLIAPAVSQAAACDGTTITTSTVRQQAATGTLPTY